MVGLMIVAVIIAVLPLVFILLNLIVKGAGSLSLAFFTRTPVPAGEMGGGVAHAIVGTLMIVGMASVIGVPIGMGAGLFCAEYPGSRLARITRFVADVMKERHRSWWASSPGPSSSPGRSTSPASPAAPRWRCS